MRNLLYLHAIVLACSSGCLPQPRPDPTPVRPERFWDPDLACDPTGTAYAVALTVDGDGAPRFFFAASETGDSWAVADPAPFGVAARARRRPRVRTGGDRDVYVLWEDSRSGPIDVYFNRSRDRGATWLPADRRVNTNGAGVSHVSAPALACDAYQRVWAVWRDDRDGFDAFYCNSSRDAGETWGTVDVRVTGLGLGRKSTPRVECGDDGTLYVAWIELRDSARHVFVNVSFDDGATWLIEDVGVGDGGLAFAFDLAVLDGGVVVVAWSETRPGGNRVFVARSTDRGRFWEPARALVARELVTDASAPRLVDDDRGHVYVVWSAPRLDGSTGIAVAASADRGASYVPLVVRLSSGFEWLDPNANGNHRQVPFDVAADRLGNVYLTWAQRLSGVYGAAIDRLGDFGRVWAQLPPAAPLEAALLRSAAPPLVAADDFGRVHVLWNEGDALRIATSPFSGQAGWRVQAF